MPGTSTTDYSSLYRDKQWWLVLLLMAIPTWSMVERLFYVLLPQYDFPKWMIWVQLFIYLIMSGVALPWILKRLVALPDIALQGLLVLLICMLIGGFFMIYPLADSGALGFISDRDEALDIAVRQLWLGGYPYDCRAVAGVHGGCPQEGNLIAPLPGGILLVMPFVALGSSAGASLGLLLTALLVIWRAYRSITLLWTLLLLLLTGMPTLIAEILTGGDHLANALAVTLAAWWCLRAKRWQEAMLAGALLGLALSWRAPFLLISIPFLVAFAKNRGPRLWWIAGLGAVVSFVAVTLPFYLYDPGGFSPLQTQGKLDAFQTMLPGAMIWAILTAVLVGIWTGWRARNGAELLMAMGWTVAVPFLWAVVLKSIDIGYPTLSFFGWYLLMPSILVVFGFVFRLFQVADLGTGMPFGKRKRTVNE